MKLIGGIGADPAVCRHPKGIGLFLAGRDDSDIFAHACGLLPSVYRQHYHTSTGIAITIPTQLRGGSAPGPAAWRPTVPQGRLPEGQDRQGAGQVRFPLRPKHERLPRRPTGADEPGRDRLLRKREHQHGDAPQNDGCLFFVDLQILSIFDTVAIGRFAGDELSSFHPALIADPLVL